MEKENFISACKELRDFHFPRWKELPEFDLYMDQVIGFAEKHLSQLSPDGKPLITPSMINNYVKNGIIPPPQNKKYNREHLAMLLMICSTKSVLEISFISDIVGKCVSQSGIEDVLDQFAASYEGIMSAASKRASDAVSEATSEEALSIVAMSNALNASAERVLAMRAYLLANPKQAEAASELTLEEKAEQKRSDEQKKLLDKAEKKLEKAEKKVGKAERKLEKAEKKVGRAERRVKKVKNPEPIEEESETELE